MSDSDRDLFWRLVKRYNQLALLLPSVEDLDPDDLEAVAEAKIVLSEMDETEAKFREVLARNAPRPSNRRTVKA